MLALLSGLALVLWLVVGRGPERARSSTTRPEAGPAGASAPLGERRAAAPTRAEGASTAVRSETARSETTAAASEPPEPAPPPPRTELRGTLVVLDERGIEHRGESGRLALDVGAGSRREVPVIGGSWTLELADEPPDAEVRFRSCVVRGAPAALEAGEPVELAREDQIELLVRWSDVPLLHVLADDTGLPLDEVSLCELPTRLRGSVADAGHPGLLAELASERGSSPIRLERDADPNGGSRVLFARAPGYEWGRIEIAEGARGEHVLRLAPAGALEVVPVEIEEYPRDIEIRLRTLPDGVEVLALPHDSRRSLVLDPFAVGRYAIEARYNGRIVGDTEAEVVAGERASATLALRPPSEKRVPLEGFLELHGLKDWVVLQLGLSGRWDGGLDPWGWSLLVADMSAAGNTYRWSAGETVPGLHRAEFFSYVAEFEVGPEGTRDARIVVPEPRRLRVWLIDAETGRHVESEPFHSTLSNPRSIDSGSHAPRSSPIHLQLPPIAVLLSTTSVEYEAASRWIEAGAEPRDVVLLLRRLQ